ncbi:SWIM zinc finger family protein [Streptomyces solicathayae]|uniref:SWIM zinc finger family protein n=1 Tax=Streptomyces solicathayae TaxID=3081768 RepID=A0ABZ0LSW3_9ACTN|nr:SWIM zinc finger family protein [Streptomyces sp. HUAS YS2]WOX22585.1 SWIM zinc finger family protein [Streptomyces sp. HUAS YS2]
MSRTGVRMGARARWTPEQVLALAPDEASSSAGSRLGVAGPWSETGCSASGEAVWGRCKGSGSTPYRTVVDLTGGPAASCDCPSPKFPCKHTLGLLLLWAGDDGTVSEGEAVPDWAERWLTGRREPAAEGGAVTGGGTATAAGPADPEAARRRAERRAARITAGARELEQRLADLVRGGLASAEQPGYGVWEETAARMVDAQAPGLAARVRELGAIPGSGAGWPLRLLEEIALTHLLDRAWLSLDRLPEPLAATVRTRVGLTAPASGPAVRDHWQVLAQYDTGDAKLTTRRIWLHGTETGRTALLLSFGAAGRAPQLALPVGAVLDAALSAYPGAGQVRAELVEQFSAPVPAAGPPPGGTTAEAIAAYGGALRDDPWLDARPATLTGVVPVRTDTGRQLQDAAGALPLTPAAANRPGLWRLVALSGGAPVTVFGECGHQGFTPLTCWSPEDPTETVPLV